MRLAAPRPQVSDTVEVPAPLAPTIEQTAKLNVTRDHWIALAMFFATVAYLCCFLNFSVMNADEGIVLQGAERILRGQVVYRDFFSFYTPGSFYWMALLFRIFGDSILVPRTALVIYGGLCGSVVYLIARRYAPRWSAFLVCSIVALASFPYRFVALHNWDSTVLALMALLSAVLLIERSNSVRAFATGSLSGLTCLFEHSKGAGLIFGLLIGFGVMYFHERRDNPISIRFLAIVGLGLLSPFAVTFGYFAAKGAAGVMLSDWVWPLRHYSAANYTPYGHFAAAAALTSLSNGSRFYKLIALFVSVPYLVVVWAPIAGLVSFVWISVRGPVSLQPNSKWRVQLIVTSTIVGLLLSVFVTRRPDYSHLDYIAPLTLVPVTWLLGDAFAGGRLLNALACIAAALILFSTALVGMAEVVQSAGARNHVFTAKGTLRIAGTDNVVSYLLENTHSGERVVIYPYQAFYYYLSGTQSGSQFDFLQPGMHTPEQFQQQAKYIEDNRPRLVLFEQTFRQEMPRYWPNTPESVLDAPDPVEELLNRDYKVCAKVSGNGFWRFVAMVPKDASCPAE